MLRKTVIALLAVASVGLASPTMALARGGGGDGGGGFHGGGMGGGGFHGGMAGGFRDGGGFHDRDGGFRGRGFHDRDRDFGRRFGFGYGFYPYDDYAYDYPYGSGHYPYAYNDAYYENGSCYVIQRRVHTTHGWRLQPRQVCS
jgi:hypothetical protein